MDYRETFECGFFRQASEEGGGQKVTQKFKLFTEYWESLEEESFRIGLTYEQHWDITPTVWNKYAKAYQEKMKEKDLFNHMLGKYISYAVNDPKKYPKKPFLRDAFGQEKKKAMGNDEMIQAFKGLNRKLKGKFNKN